MGRKMMIAIDGSEQAQYAFDWYLDSMHRPDDEVLLIHCVEYNIDVGLPGKMADVDAICAQVKKRQDEIGNLTDGFSHILRSKKVPFKILTPQGDKPGELISKAALEERVQCIIIGTRGLGKIRRTLLGSVSEYVVHHASCPVTIVRKNKDD